MHMFTQRFAHGSAFRKKDSWRNSPKRNVRYAIPHVTEL